MSRGRFITFEGGEGTGKSTQHRLLAQTLRQRGLEVVVTREPGGSPGAEEIRALLVAGRTDRWSPASELFLHFAARADHVRRVIRPSLEAGRWVLCDRFTDSTMAYQGYAQGLGIDAVDQMAGICHPGLTPDLTLIFDMDVDKAFERMHLRTGSENRYERMGSRFHVSIRNAFLDIARRNAGRALVIDASKSVSEISDIVNKLIEERLISSSMA